MTATARDASGAAISGRTFSWSSASEIVATVSSSGVVTGASAGTVQVRATTGGVTGEATVTVTAPPPAAVASVTVTPTSASLLVGASTQLAAVARDAGNNALSGRLITWSSSAEAIATVSNGLVTAISPGSAQVRATSEGVFAEATVTVTPVPVASITVTPPNPSIVAGGTQQLTATLRDAANNVLSGRNTSWSSTAEAVATVSINGLVTAIAPGSTQVRATSEGVTGQVTVTVTPVPVASVSVSPTAATLAPTQQVTITATAKDAQGATLTGRPFDWNTSNPAVASVSNAGVVTAIATGSATITASAEGKSAQAAITVVNGTIVGPAGGDVVADGGNVTVSIPPGALSSGTAITVQPLANPPAHPRLIAGTAFEFGPGGTAFAAAVNVTIKFTIPNLGAAIPVNLRLHRFTNAAWVQLPGGSVNLGALSVTGQTTTFSTYGLIEVVPPALNFISVSAGEYHSCGVAEGGQGYCWGAGEGRIGNGTTNGSPVPAPVSGGLTFTTISAGGSHSCGLTPTGQAWCWGVGTDGQLGQGAYASSLEPVQVTGGLMFTAIDAGESHTCGVTQSFVAVCWGEGLEGRLGDGVNSTLNHRRNAPTAVIGAQLYASISAGDNHTCAVTVASAIWCWGVRTAGQLGNGSFGTVQDFYTSTPVQVTGPNTWTRVATGAFHTCGINTQGAAWCWGRAAGGRLGDNNGALIDSPSPVSVQSNATYLSIAAGNGHSCGVTTGNAVHCWGRGTSGQLGIGTTPSQQIAPATVSGVPASAQVSAGGGHTCVRTTAGPLWCWGEAFFGAVGYGGNAQQDSPTAVAGPALTSARKR